MSIGTRIKEVRKALKLSQSDFAAPLGLTYAAIGAYENDLRNVSEPSILAICREYGVNEEWLRTGQGEMFVQLSPSLISNIVQEYHLDKMDQSLIEEYLKLDPASRQILKDYIRRVYLAAQEADEQAEIDREVEEYRHELENEKRASSASENSHGPEPKASGE